ncbi:MAG: L,D-transpeptidase family protein [Desulfatitalea sp.]|nr:L,D-transpeptidase family protein [Desulfatitalea sp.]NNK01165.1 L,D-transpeptidase family protein [Desulfatitalea sp.]
MDLARPAIRMFHVVIVLGAIIATAMVRLSWAAPAPSLVEQVSARIQARIVAQNRLTGFTCRGEPICGIQLLPPFYAARAYRPVWLDAAGLRPTAMALIRSICGVGEDGLSPQDYHLSTIKRLKEEVDADLILGSDSKAIHWADLDLLLTDAFLLLGSHLSAGRVNPETLHTDWLLSDQTVDMMAILDQAVTEAQLDQAIDRLRPAQPAYTRMRTALVTLGALALRGGWPQVPLSDTLRPGHRHARVLALRHRLQISGDLPAATTSESPDHLDADLTRAVKRFQIRHGLTPDGLVGRRTLAALNVPIEARIRQIELNLERLRWLPTALGARHIAVNTADFSLTAVENHQAVLRMRVVVGRPARRTPVFSAPMTYLVLNPYWTIPHTIVIEDVLPKAVADPDYFEQRSIKVYHGWDETSDPIDPGSVNWRDYGENNMPFRFVQAPGPTNPLGRIKFMFPNKFSVYLHDTPGRHQFNRTRRYISSGCIRVEKAAALAHFLLKGNGHWDRRRIQAAIQTGERQLIHIPRQVLVHLFYITAWVDEMGVLQFRNDIYDRDVALDRALRTRDRTTLLSPKASIR